MRLEGVPAGRRCTAWLGGAASSRGPGVPRCRGPGRAGPGLRTGVERQCGLETQAGGTWPRVWRLVSVAALWSKLPFVLSVFCLPGHTASLGSLLPLLPLQPWR